MKNNTNKLKKNIIATCLVAVSLMFAGSSMASQPEAHSRYQNGTSEHPYMLPPVTVTAPIVKSASVKKSTRVNISLESINAKEQKTSVVNVKEVEIAEAPYSILINKDGIKKNANMYHKMVIGDTLVTILDDNSKIRVRIMMKTSVAQNTSFTNLRESDPSINIFPVSGKDKAFILNVGRANSSNVAQNKQEASASKEVQTKV